MRYLLGFLIIGGIACAANIVILNFLKMRFSPQPPVWKDDQVDTVKDGFEQELKEFRAIIEENLNEARTERLKLEEARDDLRALVAEAGQCLEKMETLKSELCAFGPEASFEERPLPERAEARGQRDRKLSFLREQGMSAETIAHQLQMGLGEVRLRLALQKKEDAVYENR